MVPRAQHRNVVPGLNERVGYGQPASTPSLGEMWTIWHTITAAADPFLDSLTPALLEQLPPLITRPNVSESVGTMLLRVYRALLVPHGRGSTPSASS